MLFSVIIPTINRLALLKKTLESVWRQRFTDFELIIVDDGSTDETLDYLRTLGTRAKVFVQSNRGPGAARNLGVRGAQGAYLAFLDSDDLWFPWSLDAYARAITTGGEPAFIAGKPLRFTAEDSLKDASDITPELRAFDDYLSSSDEWPWWGVSSFVVSRDAFTTANGFTNEWINGEDADLALRLGVARRFVQVNSPFTFGYREHCDGATKNIQRTIAGIRYQLRAETAGLYPGGAGRARERRRILTRHVRPVSLECLSQKLRPEAWEFYRATFGWHVQLGRWKYLAGFPLKALLR
jgi:hypothetical protein